MSVEFVVQTLEPLITAEQAAEFLAFSPLTVRRMAHKGLLPSIPFPMGPHGRRIHRFRISDLQKYLDGLERRKEDE